MYTIRTYFIYTTLYTLLSLVLCGLFSFVSAAELYISPHNTSKTVGQTFTTTVYVATEGGESVNAISGEITYSKNTLDLLSISSAGSVVDFWAQEPTEAADTARFEGVIFNPGYSGSAGKVVSLQFKAKAPGAGAITLTQGTVLANDGLGSDVTSRLGNATVTIASAEGATHSVTKENQADSVLYSKRAGPVVTSSTHPDPSRWYNKTTAELLWQGTSGVTGVRLLVDHAPSATPTVVYSPAIFEKTITDLSEGVWYVHAQFRDTNGWGLVTHFPIRIDNTAPEFTESVLVQDTEVFGRTVPLTLNAIDTVSGIERYEIVIDEKDPIVWFPVTEREVFTTPALSLGAHRIHVIAFDAAGNSTVQEVAITVEGAESPVVAGYTQKLVLGDTFTIAGMYPIPGARIEMRFNRCESGTDLGNGITYSEDTECASDEQVLSTVVRENGTFSLSEKMTRMKVGVYTVVLRAFEGEGVYSENTEPFSFEVVRRGWGGSGMLRNIFEIIGLFVVLLAALVVGRTVFLKMYQGAALLRRRMYAVYTLLSRAATAMRILASMEDSVNKKIESIDDSLSKKEIQNIKETLRKDFSQHMEDLKKLLRE